MNKRHYEHTLPNIRGSLSNTYGNQCRLGDKQVLQSPCKFVCFHHSVQIIMLMNLSAHLKKRSG